MTRRISLLSLLLLAVAFLAGACSGDDGESATTTTAAADTTTAAPGGGTSAGPEVPDERRPYLEAADELCATTFDRVGDIVAVPEGADPPPEDEAIAIVEDDVIPELRGLSDDLRDLDAPAGEDDEVDAMLDEFDALIDAIENDPAVLVSGDTSGVAAQAAEHLQEAAPAYGYERCFFG